jgi:drug/metabolite transporter (DMT)-like permease
MLSVKQLSRTEPPDRIAFYFLFWGTLLSAFLAAATWDAPPADAILPLAAVGLLSWVGQIGLSRAYALGEVSRIAPLDLARLPMALLLGYVLFGEVPDALALVGMAIIGVTSIYTVVSRGRKTR